ncbi:MAG TPA: chlorite dismutase family protein [Dehalococcoidia bacterium]
MGGDAGPWAVDRIDPVTGPSLPYATHVTVIEGARARLLRNPAWVLRGVVRQDRYATPEEHEVLGRRQEPLGRPAATRAALIPIRKSEEWWQLSQDERRAIFEERSHHITIGIEYLPVVARRLHHGRDLGEPFDFLTWFEFAPQHTAAFEQLVGRLRATEEWSYVVREIDIRLSKEA